MSGCKSKTHSDYGNAQEGLYIQTWMAHKELAKLVGPEAPAGHTDAREKGAALERQNHILDEAVRRIQFGQLELAEATAAVNRHFDRGCRNLVDNVT